MPAATTMSRFLTLIGISATRKSSRSPRDFRALEEAARTSLVARGIFEDWVLFHLDVSRLLEASLARIVTWTGRFPMRNFSPGRNWDASIPWERKISTQIDHLFPDSGAGTPYAFSNGRAFVRQGLSRDLADHPSLTLGIAVTEAGRYGNATLQIANSLAIAAKISARAVFFPRTTFFPEGIFRLSSGLLVCIATNTDINDRNLPQVLWATNAMKANRLFLDPCSEQASELGTLLGQSSIALPRPARSDKLTIHLRSGDIFKRRTHKDYGPPPWAFYQRVLEYRPWSEVAIVSEDGKNPVRRYIKSWCRQNGLPVLQTGERFEEAVSHIANATNLVVSPGTFGPAVCFNNQRPRTIFSFGTEVSSLICRKITVVVVGHDLAGEYVKNNMNRNWQNTSVQRKLQWAYPIEKVGLRRL